MNLTGALGFHFFVILGGRFPHQVAARKDGAQA